ncbi:hypothetical protein ON010_g19134 [Phytophthora cinnamomi]|nr:hypothetical protein ON010_g19134 [Phytophthora cinnamomi]
MRPKPKEKGPGCSRSQAWRCCALAAMAIDALKILPRPATRCAHHLADRGIIFVDAAMNLALQHDARFSCSDTSPWKKGLRAEQPGAVHMVGWKLEMNDGGSRRAVERAWNPQRWLLSPSAAPDQARRGASQINWAARQ